MNATSSSYLLLLLAVFTAQIHLNSASSVDTLSTQSRSLLIVPRSVPETQKAACDKFCTSNSQATDAVTQGTPPPPCSTVCMKIIVLKVAKPAAMPAVADATDPFVALGVSPDSLCPDYCKEINATKVGDCTTSCIISSVALAANAPTTTSSPDSSPASVPAAPAAEVVSGSTKVKYGLATLFLAFFMAMF